MALMVFLRGVNVGGHRTFRPATLAKQLSAYEVVNVGAAGTFVVRKPGSRAKFLADLRRRLPFETEIILCDGRDLLRLHDANPFANEPTSPDVTRFVSMLSKACRLKPALPVSIPAESDWLVRIIAVQHPFVLGEYRRHMKTIGYLYGIDKLFGMPGTIRNWNTITAIVRLLKQCGEE